MEFISYSKKVHFRSIASEDVKSVLDYIRSNADGMVNKPHASDMMALRNISKADVSATLANGKLVEYHSYTGHPVALLRHDINWDSICVAVELDTLRIRTTYINSVNDNHGTLKHKEYEHNAKGKINLRIIKV